MTFAESFRNPKNYARRFTGKQVRLHCEIFQTLNGMNGAVACIRVVKHDFNEGELLWIAVDEFGMGRWTWDTWYEAGLDIQDVSQFSRTNRDLFLTTATFDFASADFSVSMLAECACSTYQSMQIFAGTTLNTAIFETDPANHFGQVILVRDQFGA